MTEHLKLFIGHKRPSFPMWPGFRYAAFDATDPTDFPLAAYDDLAGVNDQLTGEYYYLLSLRRTLLQGPLPETLTICQYRRFTLREIIGAQSENQPFARVIDGDTAASPAVGDLCLPREGNWLLGSVLHIEPTLLYHYHLHHPLRDLLRFLSDAVDAGALTDADVAALLLQKFMIPAPSVGTYPTEAFLETFECLEKASLAFSRGGFITRGGYQRRAIGFCMERLNGYLFCREALKRGQDLNRILGSTTIVSDDTVVRHTV